MAASTKSKDWEYEKEWRVLAINSDTDRVSSPIPKIVFLETRFDGNDKLKKRELKKILEERGTETKQMKLHSTEYRIMYSQ